LVAEVYKGKKKMGLCPGKGILGLCPMSNVMGLLPLRPLILISVGEIVDVGASSDYGKTMVDTWQVLGREVLEKRTTPSGNVDPF